MPVKLGNNNLTFSGISEIYVGSNKVYSAATPSLTLDQVPFYIYNSGTSAITVPFVRVIASNDKSNVLELSPSTTAWTGGVKYSTNMTNWTLTTSANISIPAKTRMFFAAENPEKDTVCGNSYYSSGYYTFFSSYVQCRMVNLNSLTCSVGGNILSLYYGTNFTNKTMSSTLSYQKSGTPNTWRYDPSTTSAVGYGVPFACSNYANFGGLLVGYGYTYSTSGIRSSLNQSVNNVNYSNLYLPFAASTSLPSHTISNNSKTGIFHNSTTTAREPIVEISSTTPAKIVGYMGYTLSLVIRGSNTIAASQVVNSSGYFYSQKSSSRPITIHMLPGQSITGLSSYSYISVVNDLDLTFSL